MSNNKSNNNTEDLFVLLANTSKELVKLISSTDTIKINAIPDSDWIKNSWTAAQLASHVTKSNKAIAQAMTMEGKKAGRNPGERVEELKNMFLNFETKFQSPDFILPTQDIYEKKSLVNDLKSSIRQFNQASTVADLTEIISLPAFGEITKLELAWFVVYHTQRHIHQLKNILAHLDKKITIGINGIQ